MAYRNSSADVGRKGQGARSQTKADTGFQYVLPQPRGRWMPAYGGGSGFSNGGMGKTAFEVDPDIGSAGNEVGNDYDNDYDSGTPDRQS